MLRWAKELENKYSYIPRNENTPAYLFNVLINYSNSQEKAIKVYRTEKGKEKIFKAGKRIRIKTADNKIISGK